MLDVVANTKLVFELIRLKDLNVYTCLEFLSSFCKWETFVFSQGTRVWHSLFVCFCSCSRSTDQMCRSDSRGHLTVEDKRVAEDSLTIYCKPVELYNIIQKRTLRNVLHLIGCNYLLFFFGDNYNYLLLKSYIVWLFIIFFKKNTLH